MANFRRSSPSSPETGMPCIPDIVGIGNLSLSLVSVWDERSVWKANDIAHAVAFQCCIRCTVLCNTLLASPGTQSARFSF